MIKKQTRQCGDEQRLLYRGFLMSLMIGLVMCLAMPVAAQDPLYVVEGIEVDVTDENAVKAREEAFNAAQLKGYEVLIARILDEQARADFTMPELDYISSVVQDYEVTDEQVAPTRYKGVYKITFSPDAVAAQGMTNGNMAGGQVIGNGNILMLPFYDVGTGSGYGGGYGNSAGRYVLWRANPFMAAWVRTQAQNTPQYGILNRFVLPRGDVQDVQIIKGHEGTQINPINVKALQTRYNAAQAVLLTGRIAPTHYGEQNAIIDIYDVTPSGVVPLRQISVRGFRGEAVDQLLNRAVQQVSQFLNENKPASVSVSADMGEASPMHGGHKKLQTLQARFQFSAPREWVQTKQKLEQVSIINQVSVQSLASRQAILKIDFYGTVDDLTRALQTAGMGLQEMARPSNYQYGVVPAHGVQYQLYHSGHGAAATRPRVSVPPATYASPSTATPLYGDY